MTLFIVLASIVLYLVVGGVYGRSQTVAAYQRSKAEWSSERAAREGMRMQVAWRIVAWPWGMVFDSIRGPIRSWLDAPLERRRDEATHLRAEADRYEALIAACDDRTDRELMRAGQKALRDRAREVDL